MKKILLPIFILLVAVFFVSCDPEPCTRTIDTFNGPQTIEVDCAFAD